MSVLPSFEFKKLPLKEYPKLQERETNESRYWRQFNWNKEITLQSAPNMIDFNPVNDQQYIVTSSLKVHLFDGQLGDKIQRSYSRFQDDAFSGKFRRDGKLITAGDKIGNVKVFDFATKSMLRQLKQHTSAVRATRWTGNGLKIISGGDDKKIVISDLATGQSTWANKTQHIDYIRSITTHPDEENLFLSGSYDHTVAFWDSRQTTPIWTVNHGHPIEYSLMTPSGSIAITAGSNEIKLWDILNGGRLLHTFQNHQKNITSLCFDNNGQGTRLLSSGLDGHIKIYSLQTLSLLHGIKFDSPLIHVNMNASNKKLIVGFVNGNLLIKNKREKHLLTPSDQQALASNGGGLKGVDDDNMLEMEDYNDLGIGDLMERQLRRSRHHKGAGLSMPGTAQKSASSSNAANVTDVVLLETERVKKLQLYEKHLQRFNYQLALDSALTTRNVVVIVTVLEELCRRNGLTIALSGRDEISLEPILSFLVQYILHPRYSAFLVQITHRLLDIYYEIIGYSPIIDHLFQRLIRQIQQELSLQKDIMRVLGSIDCVINLSTMPKRPRLGDDGHGGAEAIQTLINEANAAASNKENAKEDEEEK
mmetsp:Transcript_30845/g.33713  ORF Transcript_30845/g.33713 Transcript_30845/m.33713 type:complete len:591 (-) Transcript_30845:232-2004(-)